MGSIISSSGSGAQSAYQLTVNHEGIDLQQITTIFEGTNRFVTVSHY